MPNRMQEDIAKQIRKEEYEAFIKVLVRATGCSRKTAKQAIYHTGNRKQAYAFAAKINQEKAERVKEQSHE